jgi:hypothetical protein
MKKFIKNKKADIPVAILVIGVFAICTLAILSFKFMDIKTTKGFYESIEGIEEMNSQIQKYLFYKNAGVEDSKIEEFLEIKQDAERKYIEVEKKINNVSIIKIKYTLPK